MFGISFQKGRLREFFVELWFILDTFCSRGKPVEKPNEWFTNTSLFECANICMLTYANVHCVSSTAAGVTAHIIVVIALPPSEGCNILVNLLSRKLTNTFGLSWDSLSCNMTNPNAESDIFMCVPSLNRVPIAPVCPALSDPARSTKFSWETWIASKSSALASRLSIVCLKVNRIQLNVDKKIFLYSGDYFLNIYNKNWIDFFRSPKNVL